MRGSALRQLILDFSALVAIGQGLSYPPRHTVGYFSMECVSFDTYHVFTESLERDMMQGTFLLLSVASLGFIFGRVGRMAKRLR